MKKYLQKLSIAYILNGSDLKNGAENIRSINESKYVEVVSIEGYVRRGRFHGEVALNVAIQYALVKINF